MNKELLKSLSIITNEEQEILQGNANIDRRIYYRDVSDMSLENEINASLLLEEGKLIDIRPNTRFIHFPEHTHNFVEFVYMCQGTTTHIIDGRTITLGEGDLLFMNQHARQEILPAGENDIAVNFIILPQFFDEVLGQIKGSSSALRDFLISCLTDKDIDGNYLYFNVAGVLPVQNLMENLIWIMQNDPHNKRTISQQTMVLLFMNLMNVMDRVVLPSGSYEKNMILQLLSYLEAEYKDGSLTAFAAAHSIDIYTLGRMIKRQTGHTYTELVAEKRLEQACYLLEHTDISIADIAASIGYENTSYFYRLFKRTKGMNPREWRLSLL